MKVSFDNNIYSVGNNQEITELLQNPTLIKDMVELTGDYSFIDMKLTKDTIIPNAENLEVLVYDNLFLEKQQLIFDKYGLKEINFSDGDMLYENEQKALIFRPELRDILLAYINSMVSVNDEKYAASLISHRKFLIEKLKSDITKRERSRLNTKNQENLIGLNNKIIEVINATHTSKTCQEK